MRKTILFYGLTIAAAAVLLQWLEYQYTVRLFATEIYIVLVAVIFAVIGIWTGNRLTRRTAPAEFERNDRALESLGMSEREYEVKRIILTYGTSAGFIAIVVIIASIALGAGESYEAHLEWVGYLVMLVTLSTISVGIKRYRDQELGAAITFGKGFVVGIGIAALAGVIYVAVWEIYLALTDYAFIHEYTQSVIAAREASGVSGAELETLKSDMTRLVEQYGKPLFRQPITFMEIFPVSLPPGP